MLLTPSTPNHTRKHRGVNKIMVGTVVKAKVGDMEKDTRKGFSRGSRKEMTGVVYEVVGKRRY